METNDNGRLGRINTLLVGDPGTAKSLLAREATRITPNSRFVTAQNASGKSLVAIVDKENDSLVLRLGAIVLSKGAICAINEIGAMSLDDQQHLNDIAEEGRCTIDKYGTHFETYFEIDSPTTIIATANPYDVTLVVVLVVQLLPLIALLLLLGLQQLLKLSYSYYLLLSICTYSIFNLRKTLLNFLTDIYRIIIS